MNSDEFLSYAGERLGGLTSSKKSGFRHLLNEAETRGTPLNQLAYILATAWWETARTMQPAREAFFVAPNDFTTAENWRERNLRYYPYYGRGYVQLTWKDNYKKASKKLGIDLVENPDEALNSEHASRILFTGMEEGWFTGKALDDYIDDEDEPDDEDLIEYMNARRIINGTDKKLTIGKLALLFEKALKAAGYQGSEDASATARTAPAPAASQSAFGSHIESLGLKHFKPYEFLVKGHSHANPDSGAHGLNTDPPQSLWGNIDLTAKVLDELRGQLGRPIIMTSVYRSPAYNKAIGGASQSKHVDFNAIDFAVRGSPVGPTEWATALRQIRSSGRFRGGIGIYPGFVHVDTRGRNIDWP